MCKHILLQAIRANYVQVPLTAKTIELQDMPKRGRPAHISKALQIDTQPVKSIFTKHRDKLIKSTTSKRKPNTDASTSKKRSKK